MDLERRSPHPIRAGLAWALITGGILSACGGETVSLPKVTDDAFTRLSGIAFGMRAADISSLRANIEEAPNGRYREPYGEGWITFAFSGDPLLQGEHQTTAASSGDAELFVPFGMPGRRYPPHPKARLIGIEWRVPFPDSVTGHSRWEELVARMNAAYEPSPACSFVSQTRFGMLQAVWPGLPSASISSEVTTTPDGQDHDVEVIVVVQVLPQAKNTRFRRSIDCP